MTESRRNAWVSYLRVSTPEQAEKDLSLPAQRESLEAYAKRHGKIIAREYIEPGRSGKDANRKEFLKMLEDVHRPDSDIEVILVHHTSRFTRNATEARVVKHQLRKEGVKVISVCQEMNDDPFGHLMEGIFECIDQYESDVNGARTAAAMREAVRQGYFPGSKTPYGFKTIKVEVKPGLFRSVLVIDEYEAAVVRELFQLYVANNGSKRVARLLNQKRRWYRDGKPWSKDLVLKVLEEPAVAGTYYWGKYDSKTRRRKDKSEWLSFQVEPIVEPALYNLARQLRSDREPSRKPGRPASPENLLRGLVRCGKCGAIYTLETSSKRVDGEIYKYRYYNCKRACRIGKEACSGKRIPTGRLDSAVLDFVANLVCTQDRSKALLARFISDSHAKRWKHQLEQLRTAHDDVKKRISSWRSVLARKEQLRETGQSRLKKLRHHEREIGKKIRSIENTPSPLSADATDENTISALRETWSRLVRSGSVASRNYLHQLIEQIEIDENEITVIPKEAFMPV
ncbi:MAG: recombinase family protein [Proteobacteria bacterium]|nr:recombinase family protein [Pseudomonadota bacterium]